MVFFQLEKKYTFSIVSSCNLIFSISYGLFSHSYAPKPGSRIEGGLKIYFKTCYAVVSWSDHQSQKKCIIS